MDILTIKQRSFRMSLVRSKGTKPEQLVRRIVRQLNFKYRSCLKTLPGSPDFVFAEQKKIIFVHGCFWHQHAACRKDSKPRTPKTRLGYWRQKLINNQTRDALIQRELKRLGWRLLIVWECQLKNKAKRAALPKIIKKFLEKEAKQQPSRRPLQRKPPLSHARIIN